MTIVPIVYFIFGTNTGVTLLTTTLGHSPPKNSFQPWIAIVIATVVLFIGAIIALVLFVWFYRKRTIALETENQAVPDYDHLESSATSVSSY